MPATDRIVWIDCEMTGLIVGRDQLVEIACIVTDGNLVELDDGVAMVIAAPQDLLDQMDPIVVTMHTESGLIDEIPGGITIAEAERRVLDYVRQHVPVERSAPLAGSSVYVDRGFLAVAMPALDAHLHYRLIDVSSIKELAKRWYPRAYFSTPTKTGNHRALGDVRDSIAELRHYRQAIMVPGAAETTIVGAEATKSQDPAH